MSEGCYTNASECQCEAPSMNMMQAQLGAQKMWAPTEKDIQDIARVCHEANRAVCICNGDLSQPTWDDAPQWQKDSAINGVEFHIKNPHADPQRSHDQWMEVKLRDGWRYGATKDAEKKEHPCLLPYHALPDNEKIKDQLFSGIVRAYVDALRKRAFSY